MPELRSHQIHTRDHVLEHSHALVFNEPGTGKTASLLAAIREHRQDGGGRALVMCPKAIMEPAWVQDCKTFTPELTITPAYAGRRLEAFSAGTDIVVVNVDGAKWINDNPAVLDGFDFLIMDESTAFKNRMAQRSKAMAAIIDRFDRRVAMTGTPMPNGLIDVWHQVYLVDQGERLGSRFFAFRATTHDPVVRPGGFTEWVEKDGAREVVADILSDITILYRFEECVDIPPNEVTYRTIPITRKLRRAYDQMVRQALLELEGGDVRAVHAAALMTKLLQIASGAVYDSESKYHVLDTERYDLIAQLCNERPHTLVAFQWGHQREELVKALERAGISEYAVIDGTTRNVPELVQRFQAGEYRVLLAHPQSASHGLTLTRATTTIWASPTWDAERFEQFNRRIYRTGQTKKTETILIQAEDTVDVRVYERLTGKLDAQADLLSLLKTLSPTQEVA